MDKEMICVEKNCQKPYTIAEGEEQFYIDKGMYTPKRCKECRDKRRQEREEREAQENEKQNQGGKE